MNTFKNEYMEELLERFFEGQTSNDEEQSLYEFFAGDNVPEHLIKYKQVFAYFNEGIEDELCETTDVPELHKTDVSELHKDETPVFKIRNKKLILWSGVAAVLLILFITNPFSYGNKPFDPYEGSYIIRNGVRITDMEIIRPELEATIKEVLLQQEEAESIFNALLEDEEYLQIEYNSIIESFDDEEIRNEVREILENK